MMMMIMIMMMLLMMLPRRLAVYRAPLSQMWTDEYEISSHLIYITNTKHSCLRILRATSVLLPPQHIARLDLLTGPARKFSWKFGSTAKPRKHFFCKKYTHFATRTVGTRWPYRIGSVQTSEVDTAVGGMTRPSMHVRVCVCPPSNWKTLRNWCNLGGNANRRVWWCSTEVIRFSWH